MTAAVLYLMDGKEGGGPGSHLLNLLSGLPDEDFVPHVAFLRDGALAERFRNLGHPAVLLDKRFRLDLRVLPRLMKLIRERNIQVLHTHTYGCNFYSRAAGVLAPRLRVVATYHSSIIDEFRGDEVDSPLNRMIYRAEIWMTRLSHRLIAVSDEVRHRMEENGVPAGRVQVIGNGIDDDVPPAGAAEIARLRRERGLDPGRPVIGAVARLVPLKAINVLIDAVPSVAERVPGVQVWIVGDGRARADLEAQAARLGVADRVRFAGWSWDVRSEMRSMDLLAFPSLIESQGLVALEAMACGLPVVASDIPGVRDIVRHEETGLLVPPRDPEALAAALTRVLADAVLAARLGEAGLRRVRREYGRRAMVRRVAEVYRSALEEA